MKGSARSCRALEKFTLRFSKLAEKTITSSRLVDWRHEDYFVLSGLERNFHRGASRLVEKCRVYENELQRRISMEPVFFNTLNRFFFFGKRLIVENFIDEKA